MTDDYCKLASGIILSTVWREDDKTRILWITLLALKDRSHIVRASIPGLAAVANLSVEAVRHGLDKLMAPDPDSRTKEHEGRRVAEVDGGWNILNGEKYRNFLSKQERNIYQAKLMSERRAKAKAKKLEPVSTKLAELGQAEAEAEAEALPPSGVKGVSAKAFSLKTKKAAIKEELSTFTKPVPKEDVVRFRELKAMYKQVNNQLITLEL